MSKPIPENLMDELNGYLSLVYEDSDLPDGAWFAMLEEDCREFMNIHGINGNENDAVHQFLQWNGSKSATTDATRGES